MLYQCVGRSFSSSWNLRVFVVGIFVVVALILQFAQPVQRGGKVVCFAQLLEQGNAALEGNEAIAVVRTMLGATNGVAAAPGTIRGDFSISKQNNLVHGSDSPESADREIALWFRPEELIDYSIAGNDWVSAGS